MNVSARHVFKRLRSDDFIRQGSLMSAATIAGTLILLVFNAYMARTLGPEKFGGLGALLAIFAILSQFGNAVQLTVARGTSRQDTQENRREIGQLITQSARAMVILAVFMTIAMLILTTPLAGFLKVPSRWPIVILSVSTGFYLVIPTLRGALQGLEKFGHLAVNRVGERALLLAFGWLFVTMGAGLPGAVAALGVAGVAMLLLALIPLRKYLSLSDFTLNRGMVAWPGTSILVTVLLIALLGNLDQILAKHFLSPTDAGLYGAIARTGKIVFFVSLAFSRVLFPKASRAQALGQSSNFLLMRGLAYIVALSAVGIGIASVISETAIDLVFGDEFAEIGFLLPWYMVAVSLLSVSTVIMYYNMSIALNRHILPLGAALVLQVVLMSVMHDTALQFVIALIISLSALLVINLGFMFIAPKPASRASLDGEEGHPTPGMMP